MTEAAHRFDDALESVGRDPATVDRYLLLDPAAPVYSLSSAAYLSDAVGRAARLCFTDALTYWPRSAGWFAGDEAVLETVASDVLPDLTPPDLTTPDLTTPD